MEGQKGKEKGVVYIVKNVFFFYSLRYKLTWRPDVVTSKASLV